MSDVALAPPVPALPAGGRRHAAWAAVRLQFSLMLKIPTTLMVLVTIPSYTVIFLSVTQQADRPDLVGAAVLAPVLIALWGLAVWVSGLVVSFDRWFGVLEGVVATPTPYAVVLFARIFTITVISLVAFVEVWLTAWIGFGVVVGVAHPLEFALTVLVSVAAMAGTAVILSSLYVLSRAAITFGNSASFPIYVLGGVLVPVSLLPDWLQPLSRIVFLSWSSDLLRDALAPAPIKGFWFRLAMIAVLGGLGFAAAHRVLGLVLRKVRETGELAHR